MNHSYLELKKLARQGAAGGPDVRVAVLGDCSTQHLSLAVKGALAGRGLSAAVFDADYDQIIANVIDKDSGLYAFSPDYVVLHHCTEKAYERFCAIEAAEREGYGDEMLHELQSEWSAIERNAQATILQLNFPDYDDRIFGDYSLKVKGSFVGQLRRLNIGLMDAASNDARVGIVDVAGIQVRLGSEAFADPKLYFSSKLSMSLEAVAMTAERIADAVVARRGTVKKCVVTDLDNTLWGGVIGDDGLSGVRIGEFGDGPAFSALQTWLKELKKRGIILAVCSKNQEEIAREPFEKNPEMVLRLDDFAMFVANWEDKASNIMLIQQTLNIGMDSIVFLDDNRFERELVRGLVPEVTVPELPDDPSLYVDFLRGENLFEAASFSEADLARTGQYIAEGRRRQSASQFADFEGYLESLEMTATAAPFDELHFPRIAQLTQRSNQFNLRTIRYSEDDIAEIAASPDYLTLYFTLSDRFGDYGLISLVIAKRDEGARTLFVDTWVMSCRVLKRGMEGFVMNRLVRCASEQGFTTIAGEYLPTKKNGMVSKLYEDLGFARREDGMFILDVAGYEDIENHIEERED